MMSSRIRPYHSRPIRTNLHLRTRRSRCAFSHARNHCGKTSLHDRVRDPDQIQRVSRKLAPRARHPRRSPHDGGWLLWRVQLRLHLEDPCMHCDTHGPGKQRGNLSLFIRTTRMSCKRRRKSIPQEIPTWPIAECMLPEYIIVSL